MGQAEVIGLVAGGVWSAYFLPGQLGYAGIISTLAYIITVRLIPAIKDMFLKAQVSVTIAICMIVYTCHIIIIYSRHV